MSSPPVEWERYGDDFTFTWPTEGIGIGTRNPRENRDRNLSVELQAFEQIGSETKPLMAQTTANLSTPRGRTEIVNHLGKRRTFLEDEAGNGFSWADAIEQVSLILQTELRKGEPIVDLSSIDVPEDLPYLIKPFLPLNETTVFYGDGASGKSLWMMLLACSVRTGLKVPHGAPPAETGNVLYLDYETQDTSQARRLKRIAFGADMDKLPSGIYYRRCVRPFREEAARLAVDVQRFRIKLVVVDSLAWAVGEDTNDATPAIQTLTAIRSLGVTAAVVAHHGKADRQESGKRSIIGSAFFEHGPRSTWEVRAARGADKASMKQSLYHRKSNDDELLTYPFGNRLEFVKAPGKPVRFYVDDIPADDPLAAGTSLPARIRAALRKSTRPATAEEIAAFLEAKPATVRTTLARMSDVVNVAPRNQQGRYGLAAEPHEPEGAQAGFDAARPPTKAESAYVVCSRCGREDELSHYAIDGYSPLCAACPIEPPEEPAA